MTHSLKFPLLSILMPAVLGSLQSTCSELYTDAVLAKATILPTVAMNATQSFEFD